MSGVKHYIYSKKMSSLVLPPSSQPSPLLLRCLDILKVENTIRNATSANIDYYSTSSFSFTSLLNAFEESFSSHDSRKEDRLCVLPYFFPLAIRTLRRCFLIGVDCGTYYDATINVNQGCYDKKLR